MTASATETMVTLALLAGVGFCDEHPLQVRRDYNRTRGGLSNARLRHGRHLGHSGSRMKGLLTAICDATAMCMHGTGNDQHPDH